MPCDRTAIPLLLAIFFLPNAIRVGRCILQAYLVNKADCNWIPPVCSSKLLMVYHCNAMARFLLRILICFAAKGLGGRVH